MNKLYVFLIVIVFALVLLFLSGNSMTQKVEAGNTVSVHYTGKLKTGEVFDSSVGKEPLTFTAGAGQMIEGFDKAILGMQVGEKKTITLPPEQAYGPAGSGHELAGKTLIFDLELVSIQ